MLQLLTRDVGGSDCLERVMSATMRTQPARSAKSSLRLLSEQAIPSIMPGE